MLTRRPSSFKRSDSSAPSAVTKTYGNNHVKRWSRMGPIYEGFLHVYRGRLFAKWRRFMGAVFDENSTGHARLELYGSDKQLSTVNPARVVLLSECIAIRIVTFEKNERVIQIQQKTAPVMLIISEDIEKWHEILCRVAFPNQFVAIGTQPCSSVSPCYSGDYSIPADVRRIPVVLQCISGTSRPQLSEGNYDMYLNQSLVITSGMHSVTWDYLQITWFATGDNCFAFEIAKEGRYEFTSSQPMVPLHALRCHISLTNITTPPRFLTKNRYNYFYIPSSAIRSDSISSRPNFAQSEQQNSPKSRDQPLPSSIASGYDINTHLMNQQSNFESHRISKLPFFHRHPDHSNWYERADFEMNADDEWIRVKNDEDESRAIGWESSQSAVQITKPMELKMHLNDLIATNKVLQLAQLDESSPQPMSPKGINDILPNDRAVPINTLSNDLTSDTFATPPKLGYKAPNFEPPVIQPRQRKH